MGGRERKRRERNCRIRHNSSLSDGKERNKKRLKVLNDRFICNSPVQSVTIKIMKIILKIFKITHLNNN